MRAQDVTETLTIRLPKGLKGLVEEAAKLRSTTVTALVRESLRNALQPAGTILQSPGMTAAFDEFIDKGGPRGRPVVLVLVTTPGGKRYYFEGRIDRTFTNESMVTVVSDHHDWVIPRQEVVGWFGGDSAAIGHLAQALIRQGWAPR